MSTSLPGISTKNTASEIIKQQMPTASSEEEKPNRNLQPGRARLHLIIQFPVLNTFGSSKPDMLLRQKEYIYCLQRNLLSPHVSSLAC